MTKHDPMVVANPLAPFEKGGLLRIVAPAKTNLYLNVENVREDGFHKVTTIMHALSIHDVLYMDYEQQSEGGLLVELYTHARAGIENLTIAAEDNLAYKAIFLLAKKLGRTENETFKMRLEKHIPHQAGLGGGSSDAAAALIGAAHFWGIEVLSSEVLEAAAELGSDVPFFLYGGCAYFSGKGDIFERSIKPMKKSIVLIKPQKGVPTKEAYCEFDKYPQIVPIDIQKKAQEAVKAENVLPYNNLEKAAEEVVPELKVIKEWLSKENEVASFFLSGSGSTIVAICENFDFACRLSCEAQKKGWWARAASFSSLRAAIVPKRM